MPAPDPSRPPLDPAAAGVPPWRVEVLPECPSTNAYVAGRARAGEAAGLVVVAEHQTAGRGRLDRAWVTPARAALTFSVLLAPTGVPVARWPWLPLLAGLAVAEGIDTATGLRADLKWPNDVLVGDLKVAGILVERVERTAGRGTPPVAVLGVGINVTTTRAELPVDTATSLLLAGAADADRSALLAGVLRALAVRYDAWCAAAGAGLRAPYAARCSTPGRDVRVDLPGGEMLNGRAVGVDEAGRLEVDDGSRVHVLGAGDVVHVRPDRGPGR